MLLFDSNQIQCKQKHYTARHSVAEEAQQLEPCLLDDHQVDKVIIDRYSYEIDTFLSYFPTTTPAQRGMKKSIFRRVVFFIRKTLDVFLQSKFSLDEWQPHKWWSVYHPANRFHKENEYVFTFSVNYRDFYVNKAKELFALFSETNNDPTHKSSNQLSTYDTVMKEVQLSALQLPYSAILVDESQDLNACQIDWISAQKRLFQTHVFLVGDPAQSIYTFRGAKSQLLLQLPNCEDKFLTVTHRFCPRIANIANTILFCKEFSPQTINDKKDKKWMPYRLKGGASTKGIVTTNSLLKNLMSTTVSHNTRTTTSSSSATERRTPVAVLAYSNVELLEICMEHLFSVDDALVNGEGKDAVGSMNTPMKIAINGDGEKSGKGAWLFIQSKIQAFYDVFSGASNKLPYHPWKGYDNQTITWQSIQSDVESLELTDYSKIVSIIDKYEKQTIEIFKHFKSNIIDPAYSSTPDARGNYDVDVILSTIHGAKGMEWDCVQVFASSMSSFNSRLDKYTIHDESQPPRTGFHRATTIPRGPHDSSTSWSEINYVDYGDGINLWYVALTRAKRVLSVPPEFMALIEDFQYILKSQHAVDSSTIAKSQSQSQSPSSQVTYSTLKRVKREEERGGEECKEDRALPLLEDTTAEEEETPPKLFYLNGGKTKREASPSELKCLHRHLAQPWATEMLAADGGLFFDEDINLLEFLNPSDCGGSIGGNSITSNSNSNSTSTGSISSNNITSSTSTMSSSSRSNNSCNNSNSQSSANMLCAQQPHLPAVSPFPATAEDPLPPLTTFSLPHISTTSSSSSSSATSSLACSIGLQPQQSALPVAVTRSSPPPVNAKKKSSMGDEFGMCYICCQKADHYSSICPRNRITD
jgi:hypothetical protein